MSDLEKAKKWGFALCIAAATALALWKAPYGFGSIDDGFFLSVPHRLSMGDALFVDEWHVSQMAGLFTLPLVWLYRTVVGSTDGIMLASRYAYVAFHTVMTLLFYSRVRGHGLAAKAAALSYLIYTPSDLMALSYNTMSMDFILLSGTLLATSEKRRHTVAAGILLAFGVLCQPYFAAAYFLYALCVGARALIRAVRRTREDTWSVLDPSRLLWLTAGAASVGAAFLIYVLSTCGIGGALSNLPYILSSDPEHPPDSPLNKLRYGLRVVLTCHPRFKLVAAGWLVQLLVMLADRKRDNRRVFYLGFSCALTLASYTMFYPAYIEYYNVIMMPLIFPGFTAYILCRDKPRALFAGVFLAGLIYAAAVTLGSNNFIHVITIACAVSNAASFLFLGQFLRELRAQPDQAAYDVWSCRGAVVAAAVTVSVLLAMQLQTKVIHCVAEAGPANLTCKLQGGPADGILTSERINTYYSRICGEIQYYKDKPVGRLLILNRRCWCYLAADPMEYAAFSAWMSGENQAALDRLNTYYQVNPGKIPDYIYLDKSTDFEDPKAILAAALAQGYTLTESSLSWYLERK